MKINEIEERITDFAISVFHDKMQIHDNAAKAGQLLEMIEAYFEGDYEIETLIIKSWRKNISKQTLALYANLFQDGIESVRKIKQINDKMDVLIRWMADFDTDMKQTGFRIGQISTLVSLYLKGILQFTDLSSECWLRSISIFDFYFCLEAFAQGVKYVQNYEKS